MSAAPLVFAQAVARGVKLLEGIYFRAPRRGSELLNAAISWFIALHEERGRDPALIERAFTQATRKAERYPTPALVIEQIRRLADEAKFASVQTPPAESPASDSRAARLFALARKGDKAAIEEMNARAQKTRAARHSQSGPHSGGGYDPLLANI